MFPVVCFKNGRNLFFFINTISILILYVDPPKIFQKSNRDKLRCNKFVKSSYWKVAAYFIDYV